MDNIKLFQPWGEGWRKELTFIPWIPPAREDMEAAPVLPMYPIFVAGIKQRLEGDDFWKAVSGAIVYLIGHEPDNPLADLYVRWLNVYNPDLAKQLTIDGTIAASKYDLSTAIWMLQAAIMLDSEIVEAHFNAALAYFHLGEALEKEKCDLQAKSSYYQTYQYLKNTVELDESSAVAYYILSIVALRLGKDDEGKVYLKKAMVLGLKNKNSIEKVNINSKNLMTRLC